MLRSAPGSRAAFGTAVVQQQILHLNKSLAFKRPKPAKLFERSREAPLKTQEKQESLDDEYRNLISEVTVLCHPWIRFHPNIIELEAICWDFDERAGNVWPVLIFEKADEGDLATFLSTARGRSLSISKRLELCQDVAIAMLCLHRFGIIHGDINPRNLLVFNDKDSVYIKMSDFGYAAVMHEGENIDMARTWPWYAPEIESQWSFDFEDARRTDYYSFAMVCAFMMLDCDNNSVMAHQTCPKKPTIAYVEELRHGGIFLSHVLELVRSLEDMGPDQKQQLVCFFENSLVEDPEKRTLRLHGLFFNHAKRTDIGAVIFEEVPPTFFKPDPLPWSAQFQIVKIWVRTISGDFRLWTATFDALKIQAEWHPDVCCRQNAAWQLAICFELGFGCTHSSQISKQWLEKCSRSMEDLQNELRSLGNATNSPHPGGDFQNWGYTNPLGAYIADNVLQRAEDAHCQAISDLRRVLPRNDHKIQQQRLIVCNIMVLSLRWEEANDLISAILVDCRKYEVPKTLLIQAIETKRRVCAQLDQFRDAATLLSEAQELGQIIDGPLEQFKGRRWRVIQTGRAIHYLQQLGINQTEAMDYRSAENTFLKFLEVAKKYYGPEHNTTIEARADLAILYHLSKNPKVMSLIQEVLDLCERNDSKYTLTETLRMRVLLCRELQRHGKLDEALRLAVRNLDDCRSQLGVYQDHTMIATKALADIYSSRSQEREAQALRESIVAAQRLRYGEHQPATAFSELDLSSSLFSDVDWDASLSMMERAVGIIGEACGDQHAKVVYWRSVLTQRQGYIRKWERIGMVIPISITKAVGRRFNRLQAWYLRWKHNYT